MKSQNFYFILSLVIIAFICRMLLETFQLDWEYRLWYLSLFTVVSAYYGIYAQRHNSDETFDFLMDVKGGAQLGALFALGTSTFTFIFYQFIHPSFLANYVGERRSEILSGLTETGADAATLEAALTNFNNMAEMLYTPLNWSVITLTFITFLSLFYSLIFALIAKFFPKFINK